MKAYYDSITMHVIRVTNSDLNMPFVLIEDMDEYARKISDGFIAKVSGGQVVYETDKSALVASIRSQRKSLLEDADAQVNRMQDDALISNSQVDHELLTKIAIYRKSLRDIVETSSVESLIWPERPW